MKKLQSVNHKSTSYADFQTSNFQNVYTAIVGMGLNFHCYNRASCLIYDCNLTDQWQAKLIDE